MSILTREERRELNARRIQARRVALVLSAPYGPPNQNRELHGLDELEHLMKPWVDAWGKVQQARREVADAREKASQNPDSRMGAELLDRWEQVERLAHRTAADQALTALIDLQRAIDEVKP
jgi:hypothetical protein